MSARVSIILCVRNGMPRLSISGQILLAPKFEKRNHRRAGLALIGPLMQGQPANVNESTIAISVTRAPTGAAR